MAGMIEAGLNLAADQWGATAAWLSLHSADPTTLGDNETSAGRVSAGWGAASGGAITATNKSFSGGASSGACTHVGYWSASTSGTFYGSRPLTGDQAFNAAGDYTVDSVTETFSSA